MTDATNPPAEKPKRVWVVHGRNKKANKAMYAFLRALRLDPYEWPHAVLEQAAATPLVPQIVNDVIAKSPVVIVLLTGDEVAYLRGAKEDDPEGKPGAQPRQNVLIEAGLAMGLLPGRVFFVRLGDQRPITNLAGAYITSLHDVGSRKEFADRLAKFLEADTTGAEWKDEGDFEGCIDKSPLAGGPAVAEEKKTPDEEAEELLEAKRQDHAVEKINYKDDSFKDMDPGSYGFMDTDRIDTIKKYGYFGIEPEYKKGVTWEFHKLPNGEPWLMAWVEPGADVELQRGKEINILNIREAPFTELLALDFQRLSVMHVFRHRIGMHLRVEYPHMKPLKE